MTTETRAAIDWAAWLRRWDAQQGDNIPDWGRRFEVMLDALEIVMPAEFVALDLACGPGSISRRLLERFPGARVLALDYDPVLLALGRGTLGDGGGRLRWIEADLMTDDWFAAIEEPRLDAVLSTTALHWLSPAHLGRVYRTLGRLLRPGGVLLNGDYLEIGAASPTLDRVAMTMRRRHRDAVAAGGAESWTSFWAAVAATPALQDLYAERERRFGPVGAHTRTWVAWSPPVWEEGRGWAVGPPHEWTNPTYDFHAGALRDAGFAEVGTLWQGIGANRVLMAVR
jgi:SAM-dependent methyltransferase